MLARPLEQIGIAERLEQTHAGALRLQIFGMLERQIHELAFRRIESQIPHLPRHAASRIQRPRVGGKRTRRVTKHIARKLV
ncbi:hypothetical protein D3C83_184570 [compost metagenome]